MASSDKGKTVLRTVPPPLPSPATGSANPASSLQALWPYIAPALDHIFTGAVDDPARAPSIDVAWYAGIHSNVYNYCTAQSASADALSGADLYGQLDRYLGATARDVLLSTPPPDAPGIALARFLAPAYTRYASGARSSGRLLHYIDRHYVKRAVDEDRGWLRAADAFGGRPPVGVPRAELAQRLRAHRTEALRTWGWDPAGEPASRSAAEASAEAGSAPDRVIPVNTLALRRFRTEVVDPLLAAPKPKGKKKGKKKPGAEPRGRLARAVKALLEPAEEQENVQPPEEGQESAQPREAAQGSSSIIERVSDEERLRLVQDLANMLRAVGVRPDHLLRKKLDGYLLAHAASVKT